ncbi:hypothetical protein I5M23_31385, partial [Pseudomonas aeruginosa]|nr:hypothetical protein [Pseudomonas aeruginosa]
MTESKICTCPSGDGSLRWPCPKHPAVEQAGGDERAAFKTAYLAEFDCDADGDDNMAHSNTAWRAWKMARTALAQPSPAPVCTTPTGENCPGDGVKSCKKCPEQAEAERPEAVAYRTIGRHEKHQHPHYALYYYKQNAEDQAAHWREVGCEVIEDELMTVTQHDRIVGELRAKAVQLREALEWRAENQAGQRELLRSVKEERDAAQARVAELEACGAPALLAAADYFAERAKGPSPGWVTLSAVAKELRVRADKAPVAQAQQLNDLDKQCRDDVARALGLRPNQERGFAWSYLLASIKSCVKASGDSA